jgi:BCS1 N terminal
MTSQLGRKILRSPSAQRVDIKTWRRTSRDRKGDRTAGGDAGGRCRINRHATSIVRRCGCLKTGHSETAGQLDQYWRWRHRLPACSQPVLHSCQYSAQYENTANPSQGFGLAGLGAAAAFAQRGVRNGAALLKRRLLVDVEINNRDESYQWFLYWLRLHEQGRLPSAHAKPLAKATLPETQPKPRSNPSFRD